MNDKQFIVANRDTLFRDLKDFIHDHQSEDKKLALMLIKIHRFRRINMVFGYEGGDQVLNEFVARLHRMARSKDYIARVGNSEFVLVLPEIMNEGHATLAATKLQNILETPFTINGNTHRISASIGVSIFPTHAQDISELINNAEIALVDARSSPRLFSIYSEKIEDIEVYSWDIEGELDKAVDNDELSLYFQPQVNLQTGEVFGAEALIRWCHPEKGFIRPDIFIPIAEQSGQIHKLTWWTLNTALRLITKWPESTTPIKLALNISAKVLKDVAFVDLVKAAQSIWNTPRGQLTLEITESALMEDLTTSFITLDELKSLGVGISIDDFGTGYSSMAYFKNIPANELKIDQSFVFYMLENAMDKHIVTTIIDLARGFNLNVVAEGIENVETFNVLKEMGCNIAQGYYLAKPMPQDEFIQWLKEYQLD